jgi:hypothetical protein
MIIVMISGPISRQAAATPTEVTPMSLRSLRVKIKVLRQASLKDVHGSALLFFHLLCAKELGW